MPHAPPPPPPPPLHSSGTVEHRVLQAEVVLEAGQAAVHVRGQEEVWDGGEARLHGQDVRSQRERDVG